MSKAHKANIMRLPKHDCDKCSGSGMIVNHYACGMMVRRLREEAGISLRKLAGMFSVSPSYWSDLETGKRGANFWTQESLNRVIAVIKGETP